MELRSGIAWPPGARGMEVTTSSSAACGCLAFSKFKFYFQGEAQV